MIEIETPAEAERRVLRDRRRSDSPSVDVERRAPHNRRTSASHRIHIGSIGAATREMQRGLHVCRSTWGDERLYLRHITGSPLPMLVMHRHGHDFLDWRMGAEDLIASDWAIFVGMQK